MNSSLQIDVYDFTITYPTSNFDMFIVSLISNTTLPLLQIVIPKRFENVITPKTFNSFQQLKFIRLK